MSAASLDLPQVSWMVSWAVDRMHRPMFHSGPSCFRISPRVIFAGLDVPLMLPHEISFGACELG